MSVASQTQFMKEYKWYNSYVLPLDMQCVVVRAELSDAVSIEYDIPSPLTVEVKLVGNQINLLDCPSCTLFSEPLPNQNIHFWGSIVPLPVKIRELPLDTVLTFTVRSADGQVVCGTTMHLFDPSGVMKQGKQKLMLFFREADPNVVLEENLTPGEYYEHFAAYDQPFLTEKRLETYRKSLHQTNGTSWLDSLASRQIREGLGLENSYRAAEGDGAGNGSGEDESKYASQIWGKDLKEFEVKKFSFLIVELPIWQYSVLYEEKQYPSGDPHYPPSTHNDPINQCICEQNERMIEFSLLSRDPGQLAKPIHFNPSWLTVVADWDMDEENLAEEQNRRLMSLNVRKGSTDATVRPNKDEKKRIDAILQSVGSQMSIDEINFLYRFRYSLTDNKNALIKFLYTVNWEEESEVAELPSLLALWREKAPIDVADALKLLSKEKSFEHQFVREFAVSVLRSASDDELLTFLLQLVQALRYEPVATSGVGGSSRAGLVGVNTSIVPSSPPEEEFTMDASIIVVNSVNPNKAISNPPMMPPTETYPKLNTDGLETLSPLGKFLVDRACASPAVANFLYWYLKVEMDDEVSGPFFSAVYDAFLVQLSTTNSDGNILSKRLLVIENYIKEILTCQKEAIKQGRKRDDKIKVLRKLLETKDLGSLPNKFDFVLLPLNPSVKINGLLVDKTYMFASAVYPCRLEFTELSLDTKPLDGSVGGGGSTQVSKAKVHRVIFKSGDDLRQDQLIMQMIALMDSLLKKVNLDLKLLTYGILAITQSDGIMEFVEDSMPLSAVEREYSTITSYLKKYNYDKSGDYEISHAALDTFVKSTAGYSVITYILGIGDRHLDNVMINQSGQLFHIDFGFIFGRDPKPFPPPFRITRTMADAMGGEDSEHFGRFKTYCCQSYNWLRKSANLILNLLSLMGDAGINDISKHSDLPKVLLKVEERFRLDLTDEQAEQYFLGLINESLHSLAPKLMEVAHKVAVAWR